MRELVWMTFAFMLGGAVMDACHRFFWRAKHEEWASSLRENEVEWVVTNAAELGVKIKNQFFFLVDGRSIQLPGRYRAVYKKEFGDACRSPRAPFATEEYEKFDPPHIGLVWHTLPSPPTMEKRT